MMDELMQLLKTLEQGVEEMPGDVKYAPGVEEQPAEDLTEDMTLLDGCCYMPPLVDCAEDLCRICLSKEELDAFDCDYYLGTLCHLMMHQLCTVLDACDLFDESSALRECCVSLLQNMDTVVPHIGNPDKPMLLQLSIKLAKCCKSLSEETLSGAQSYDACVECLKCCLDILTFLKCETARAKLERCINSLT